MLSPLLEVGLTGGIASGKSHVLARLEAGGCHVLDLDRVSRKVMAPEGSAYRDVVEAFGDGILDPGGEIDRRRLGERVFGDPGARARLEALVHPRIREEERRRAAELAAGPGGVLVTDAALLVETGSHLRFDRLVVVDVAPAEQRRRLMARDGIDAAAAQARIDAQMPVAEKRRFGHFVIDTGGRVEETEAAADRLAGELRALAAAPVAPHVAAPEHVAAALACGPRSGAPTPLALAESIPAHDGLELRALAEATGARRSWYTGDTGSDDGGQGLAPVLAVWATARRGLDPPFLAAASWSLSRLLGARPEAAAEAGLLALAAAAGLERTARQAHAGEGEAWRTEVERWCGASPGAPAALRAALEEPSPAAARSAAGGGASGAWAAALVALWQGRGDREAEAPEREAAAALCRWAAARPLRPRR